MFLGEIIWSQGALGIDCLAWFDLSSWFLVHLCINSHARQEGRKWVLRKCLSLNADVDSEIVIFRF